MTPEEIEDVLFAYESDVAVWTRNPDKYNYAEVLDWRKKIAAMLEAKAPPEATGLQCEKDGVCALVSRNDDEWHCTACNGDFVRKQPVEPAPVEATGLQPVRRWNAKYPGISMLEHNGELIRSGFGPYVLAEDYDRLSRMLDAVEKARAVERKARQRLQTELLALCTQHVGGELDPDNANPAGNSHHE